ncbi:hypothetical protein [Mycolicibacterium sp.]|uniref:hypothetical protein n=1 Tax=Mycolicibacterium sp. TaxID=2320850 RepID=UPI00356051A8
MTNPDQAANKALQAANSIAAQVGQLWQSAHHDGLRNGLEIAAQMLEGFRAAIADDYSLDAAHRDLATYLYDHARDQVRLFALTVPEPEPANFGTAANDA